MSWGALEFLPSAAKFESLWFSSHFSSSLTSFYPSQTFLAVFWMQIGLVNQSLESGDVPLSLTGVLVPALGCLVMLQLCCTFHFHSAQLVPLFFIPSLGFSRYIPLGPAQRDAMEKGKWKDMNNNSPLLLLWYWHLEGHKALWGKKWDRGRRGVVRAIMRQRLANTIGLHIMGW